VAEEGVVLVDKVVVGIIIGVALWLLLSNRQQPTEVSNAETWNWTDWQGKQRSITVRRDVHAS
jgi:hypothetical protein